MKRIKETFRVRLKEARDEANLTMKELADLIGTTSQSIYLWEKGEQFPTDTFFDKICESLNIDCDWILGIGSEHDVDAWIYDLIKSDDKKQEAMKKFWEVINNL